MHAGTLYLCGIEHMLNHTSGVTRGLHSTHIPVCVCWLASLPSALACVVLPPHVTISTAVNAKCQMMMIMIQTARDSQKHKHAATSKVLSCMHGRSIRCMPCRQNCQLQHTACQGQQAGVYTGTGIPIQTNIHTCVCGTYRRGKLNSITTGRHWPATPPNSSLPASTGVPRTARVQTARLLLPAASMQPCSEQPFHTLNAVNALHTASPHPEACTSDSACHHTYRDFWCD